MTKQFNLFLNADNLYEAENLSDFSDRLYLFLDNLKNYSFVLFYLDIDIIEYGNDSLAFSQILEFIANDNRGKVKIIENQNDTKYIYKTLNQSFELELSNNTLQVAADCILNNKQEVFIIDFINNNQQAFQSVLKIHTQPYLPEKPLLANINQINHDIIEFDLFWEKYIGDIFKEKEEENLKFKNEYKAFKKDFNFSMWKPKDNPFPAHGLIHKHLKGKMQDDKTGKGFHENVEVHEKWGEIMAILNFYTFNTEISDLNQEDAGKKRRIFSAGKGTSKIFLSTDFENGEMEICGHNGKHLYEVYRIDNENGTEPDNVLIENKNKWKRHCIKTER